jgi:hypothetical protein
VIRSNKNAMCFFVMGGEYLAARKTRGISPRRRVAKSSGPYYKGWRRILV